MRRAGRIAIGIAAGVLVLWVLLAAVLPLVVRADAFRPQVESRLTSAIGRPVRLGSLRLTLWTGIAVRADRIEIGGEPSLEAGSVRVGLALAPLLRREVRPRWLAVDGAVVRRGSAEWLRETTVRARVDEAPEAGMRARGRIEGTLAAEEASQRAQVDFDVVLAGKRLSIGSLQARVGTDVLDVRGAFDGLGTGAVEGRVEGSARLAGITVNAISAEATYRGEELRLSDGKFRLHGGDGTVSLRARPRAEGSPFEIDASLRGVDLESFATEAFPAAGAVVDGPGSATMRLSGRAGADDPKRSLEGKASVDIGPGNLRSIGILRQVAELLEKAGGRGIGRDTTPFTKVAASFDVGDGVARTKDLAFRSPDLDLDGGGTVGLDGSLALDVVTAFSEASSAELTARTPQLKFRVGDDGRLTIPMKIRGNLEAPAVQLDVDKVLQEGLRQELKQKKKSILKRLLGRS